MWDSTSSLTLAVLSPAWSHMHRRLLRQLKSWQSCSLALHFTPLQASEDQILLVSWLRPLTSTSQSALRPWRLFKLVLRWLNRPITRFRVSIGNRASVHFWWATPGMDIYIMSIISQFCIFQRRVRCRSWTHFELYSCRLPPGPQTQSYPLGIIICLKCNLLVLIPRSFCPL